MAATKIINIPKNSSESFEALIERIKFGDSILSIQNGTVTIPKEEDDIDFASSPWI